MPKPISEQLRDYGKAIHLATLSEVEAVLNRCLGATFGSPFRCTPGRLVASSGEASARFAGVVHATRTKVIAQPQDDIPIDHACAVIDLVEELDIEELRQAHGRCLFVKNLPRTELPSVRGTPIADGTLCVIYARRSAIPIDDLAEELCRLNERLDHFQWVDMIAVSETAVVSYGCQFAGRQEMGGLAPPSKGVKQAYSPAWYIIPAMQATGERTFNKIAASIAGYTVFFVPGTLVPEYQQMQAGGAKTVVTLPPYQYNLAGDLRLVPPEHYIDQLLPLRPFLVEAEGKKELLATLTFIPWQDGGVILLRGKLPLEGLLIFLGQEALGRGGVVRTGPYSQDSYVLPITLTDFHSMMERLRTQSNMIVRQDKPKYVMEKIVDERPTTPFSARLFTGLLQMRNTAFPASKQREDFDKALDAALTPLLSARAAALEAEELWTTHLEDIRTGKGVRYTAEGPEVIGNFHRSFRREVDSFLYDAAKALKEGVQKAGKLAGSDIGFLFQKASTYQKGLGAMQMTDPLLAKYLNESRDRWSERLISARNNLDHGGWTLPKTRYALQQDGRIEVLMPTIEGTPAVEFINEMLDRLCCFAEEFLTHCFQARVPSGAQIAELPPDRRNPRTLQRFQLTLKVGGRQPWRLSYPDRRFEEL